MESKNEKCTKLMLDSFYSCLSKYEFTERELVLTQQSYLAFKSDEYMYSRDRNQMERLLNGDVVTDSETDNDSEYYNGDRGDIIKKKVQSIRHRTKRRIAKGIAERKFLHWLLYFACMHAYLFYTIHCTEYSLINKLVIIIINIQAVQ